MVFAFEVAHDELPLYHTVGGTSFVFPQAHSRSLPLGQNEYGDQTTLCLRGWILRSLP